MKTKVFSDEMFPVMFIDKRGDDLGVSIEIDEDTYNEIIEAERRFYAAQAILRRLYEEAK